MIIFRQQAGHFSTFSFFDLGNIDFSLVDCGHLFRFVLVLLTFDSSRGLCGMESTRFASLLN
jgi:hypothetical protein